MNISDRFQVGAAWHPLKQPVQQGFETTFTFRFTGQDPIEGGGDGLAFVMQNQSDRAIGGYGASGGFLRSDDGAPGGLRAGITRAVGIFFDTFRNAWDDSDNSIAICANGPAISPRWPPHCLAVSRKLKVHFKNGKPHTARIVYMPPSLSVYLDGGAEPVFAAPVDVGTYTGEDPVWVGFTASTGGSFERHEVLSWRFEPASRPDVSSTMTSVDSRIAFRLGECLPGKQLCTPEKAIVEEKGPGEFHVYLPAHIEWGASIRNPEGLAVRVYNVSGLVCWSPALRDRGGCNGPAGNGRIPGPEDNGGFMNRNAAVGSLVVRSLNGSVWFSVNDRSGAFADNEGYFEFDVTLSRP